MKKGAWNTSWRRRHFKLTDTRLVYSKTHEDTTPKGWIELSSIAEVQTPTPPSDEHHPHEIALVTRGRVWRIAADSLAEKERWAQEITRACQPFSKPSPPPSAQSPSSPSSPSQRITRSRSQTALSGSGGGSSSSGSALYRMRDTELRALVVKVAPESLLFGGSR
jgi:hypothetical protein